MKKIAILMPAMRTGGAERILLNILKKIKNEYLITLILNKIENY